MNAKEVQRDVMKLAATGLTIVVVIKLLENSGGVAEIAKALFGGYNATLGTLLSGRTERI